MAAILEIQNAMKTLIGAGLRNTPERAALNDLAATWARLLRDVPGEALLQAADDLAMQEEFWPSLKRIREAAHQVQIHNFTSAAPNPWKDETRTLRAYDWCAKIGMDGHYYPLTIDTARPYQPGEPVFPPGVAAELQAIEDRTGGILGEEEYARIDAITAPYLGSK